MAFSNGRSRLANAILLAVCFYAPGVPTYNLAVITFNVTIANREVPSCPGGRPIPHLQGGLVSERAQPVRSRVARPVHEDVDAVALDSLGESVGGGAADRMPVFDVPA
jgi:hypothetical protein